MNDAQGTLGAGKIIDKFISDFSPAEQSQLWKNIMFNFMNLAFGMAAAPVFNTCELPCSDPTHAKANYSICVKF